MAILVAVFCIMGCGVVSSFATIEDYYWRQYTSNIPHDALPVVDEYGDVLYIGQALYPLTKALVPANIFPGNETAYTSAGGETIYYTTYPKILCSPNKDRFKWIPISIEKLKYVKFHLVVGGTESDRIVYIGRGYHDGKLLVGKVFPSNTPYKGLWLPTQNGGENLSNFEILVYDIY